MTTNRWALVRRFGPLALIILAIAAAFASGVTKHLSLHELRERHTMLQALVKTHPWLSLSGYIGLYGVVVALSLPVALIMTLTGGLLFGAWIGGLAATVGCTIGATVIFLICRTAAGDVLRERAGPTAAKIEAGVRRDAFSYVMMLRLAPVMPFWLANLGLGFVEIPLPTFIAASFLGILPVSLIYAGLGSGLTKLFAKGVRPDLHIVMHPQILLPLLGLSLLSLGPVLVRWLRPKPRA